MQILIFSGACVSLYIGAGFATMQEVLQYEASYGSSFWIVILIAAIIYLYTNLSFATNGSVHGISRGGDIYSVYCGKRIGSFYDVFSALFCYMSFIVMLGGANSTAMQQWGLPNGAGALILAIAVLVTVLGGLNGILKALAWLGPVIILFLLIVAGASSINGTMGFADGLAAIDSKQYVIPQIGGGNPLLSGISYGGFVILWFASFLAEIGAKNKLKNVNTGMAISSIFIFGIATLCCMSLISNVDLVVGADIPALVLANRINVYFGIIFAVVIFIGIFTSAVPLLWTGIRKISQEGTVKYRFVSVAACLFGLLIAIYVPYSPLLNLLYGLNGYLGFILVACMLVSDIKLIISTVGARECN